MALVHSSGMIDNHFNSILWESQVMHNTQQFVMVYCVMYMGHIWVIHGSYMYKGHAHAQATKCFQILAFQQLFEAVNAAVCTMLPRLLAVLVIWGLKTPVFADPEAGYACS